MYFNFFGGSALLHILASHPKVVAALGIATTVAYLSTPLGTRHYLGIGDQVQELERSQQVAEFPHENVIEGALVVAANPAASDPKTISAVRHALRACGEGCADLTPAAVLQDEALLRKAVYIAELDRSGTAVAARRPTLAGQLTSR